MVVLVEESVSVVKVVSELPLQVAVVLVPTVLKFFVLKVVVRM